MPNPFTRFAHKQPSLRARLAFLVILLCLASLFLRHALAIDIISYEQDPVMHLCMLMVAIILMLPNVYIVASFLALVVFTPASAGEWLGTHGVTGCVTLLACSLLLA